MPCCDGNKTMIIKSHGSMTGTQFDLAQSKFGVPVNVITLTVLGETVPFAFELDREISLFYTLGHKIFEDNDKSLKKTQDGQNLERLLQTRFPRLQIRNHVYNPNKTSSPVNNMNLVFTGSYCNEHSCGMDCYNVYIPYLPGKKCVPQKKRWTLEHLIANESSVDCFIIIACRVISPTFSSQTLRIMKETSL